jgi:hypothetical protein
MIGTAFLGARYAEAATAGLAEVAPTFLKNEEKLARVGELLRVEGEKLLRERAIASQAERTAGVDTLFQQELGAPHSVIKTHSGVHIGLFSNNNVVMKRGYGDVSLLNFSPVQSFSEPRLLLYVRAAQGRDFIKSFQFLREEQGDFYLSTPKATESLLRIKGADDTFLSQFMSVAKPVGIGSDRLAMLMPNNDIALLGPKAFRPAVPELLFPKTRIVNQGLQVEMLDRAETLHTSIADVENVQAALDRSGWEFRDRHLAQVGRLPDNSLRLLDAGCPVAKPYDQVNQGLAAAAYQDSIKGAVVQYGKFSHPVGALTSRLGMHQMNTGSYQSAEESLATGLNALTNHRDWIGATEAADNLAKLYGKIKPERAKEYVNLKDYLHNLSLE